MTIEKFGFDETFDSQVAVLAGITSATSEIEQKRNSNCIHEQTAFVESSDPYNSEQVIKEEIAKNKAYFSPLMAS